jgi:altronate hydrolase
MDTPGYDPVSATGQVAGGANIICFTTGRGSAYGCKPSPSLKLPPTPRCGSAGRRHGHQLRRDRRRQGSIAEVGQRIFELVLATASGEASKSERTATGRTSSCPGNSAR